MIFSNSTQEHSRAKCSKIGELFSSFSGATRVEARIPTRTVEAPKLGSGKHVDGGGAANQKLDQSFIDSKVDNFGGQGHASGTRQPGEVTGTHTPDTPEIAEYKAKHQKEWQAKKDAEVRDKLFGQTTAGRVDGKEVEPFSSATLEKNADELVKAKETALPPTSTTLLRTAAITTAINVPINAAAFIVVGSVNEALKPKINPTSPPATEQSVKEGRLVDHTQQNVFLLTNTLATMRGEEHVGPSLKWVAQTTDERLDSLENMLDYVEEQFAKEAQRYSIDFVAASTGAQKDDVAGRTTDMDARMAALTVLMKALKGKIAP